MSLLKVCPLPTIGELLRLYRIKALRNLSQNFLLDLRLTSKIVRSAGCITDGEVCEVGPGPGSITRSILDKNPSRLIVVEKDERFKPMLENLAEWSYNQFDIIYADILNYDMSKVFTASMAKDWKDEPPNISLIGNLPFNIATALIILWLKDISLKRSAWCYGRVKMTLTFQKEVAMRMVAPPNSKFRCRLSVMTQNWCNPHFRFEIPGRAFIPKPDVDVGVVHLEPLPEPLIPIEFEVIEKVLRSTFNGRQKYVNTTLQNLFPKNQSKELVADLLHMARVKPVSRAFELKNEEWREMCLAYKEICDRDPRLYGYDFRGCRQKRETDWMNNSPEVGSLPLLPHRQTSNSATWN